MAKYHFREGWHTPNELSEMSGIPAHTIRDRLRRGYSVEEAVKAIPITESVKEFSESSSYEDWIGIPMADLHKIYWGWCVSHGYTPLQIQGFSRQLMGIYPNLKIVPSKVNGKSCRVIRLRS